MPTDCISYQDSGYFTSVINDYLDNKPALEVLYNRYPAIDNFAAQISEKTLNYNYDYRAVLVSVLNAQYSNIDVSLQTKSNITALGHDNTFTITTGHQLNLFTGPLYFLYKIISAINLAKQLKQRYPANHFVPVYWMATEDHDFEEINYFNFNGKKFRWNHEAGGPVGRLSTEGLDSVYEYFSLELGPGANADRLREWFRQAYLKHDNLADATRYLANELFAQSGLVIIDADSRQLKRLFVPYIKEELISQRSFTEVSKTLPLLAGYTIQVNPRELNLFYIDNRLRERILFEDGIYKVNNTDIRWTTEQLMALIDAEPERFSPNVVLRPLYEEVILPNLCYIGGGGELAYWFELKSMFDAFDITFPILLLRNSALLVTQKQAIKTDRLGLDWADLFMEQTALLNNKVRAMSETPIDFSEQKASLELQFAYLHTLAGRTDKSFCGAVKAQHAKQLKGLEKLEKRFLKAQKRRYADELGRIRELQNQLFPGNGLQERKTNFSEFYLLYGDKLTEKLITDLKPLQSAFNIEIL